jgi:hypothetical protein
MSESRRGRSHLIPHDPDASTIRGAIALSRTGRP